jgi:HSP20 family protein
MLPTLYRTRLPRLFTPRSPRPTWGFPVARPETAPVNVESTDTGARLTAEVPGYDPEQIEVSVKDNVVTISGRCESEQEDQDRTYLRRERVQRCFSRSFALPFQVAEDGVEATCERGLLRVELPRVEAELPRKIEVKVS